jgi:hypothetical protein
VDAAEAATDWLSTRGVSVQKLGVDGPITATVRTILANLFGIELSNDAVGIWNNFVNGVTDAMSAQA